MPDAVLLGDASVTRPRPVRRRILELLTGAAIGAVFGCLIWSLTSEAFWLLIAPILGAFFFEFSPRSQRASSERNAFVVFDSAIRKALLSATNAGRISLCADEVLLSILDEPPVAAYLEKNGFGVAQMRAEVQENVSKWPRARAAGRQIRASHELHGVIQRAVVRRINEGRDPNLVDLLEALLLEKEQGRGALDGEMRQKVEDLPRTNDLLHEVAVLHWLGRRDEKYIAKELGIEEEAVRRELESRRGILFPNADFATPSRRLVTWPRRAFHIRAIPDKKR